VTAEQCALMYSTNVLWFLNCFAGKKEKMTKEERQREMDETFLGKIIFCSCHDLNCGGMSAML
jgi:hypothetical protein